MKFILDENLGKKEAKFLKSLGHKAIRIREMNPGIPDYEVLAFSVSEKSILVTSDKDFGELIFKEKQPHSGVILLRLEDESSSNKITALKFALPKYITGKFIVVEEKDGKFRIRPKK